MRWLKLTAVSFLLFISLVSQVSSNAMFELELSRFFKHRGHNGAGRCCNSNDENPGNCSQECNIKFRVCLNVYQQVIDYKQCTFGEMVTPVLGSNEVDFNNVEGFNNPVQFSLDSWQHSFTLIIEAWHEVNGSALLKDWVLVHRLMKQRWLEVNSQWNEDRHVTDQSSLSYKYRVVCQEHYYGEGCRKWCKPRDDPIGHYVCDGEGNVVCREGWNGADRYCLTSICKPDCHKTHGSCDKPGECKCHLGWQGELCDSCTVYPGCHHGTCDKPWACNCDQGWGGLFCNKDLNYCTNHKPCKNGATCQNTKPGSYSCQCPAGFRGTNCEITNHTCATDPCQNGGTCLDTGDDGFVCQCPSGFNGQYCHISGKTCANRPCLNDAICRDTIDGFQCHCRHGFEGETCQTAVNECDSNPCGNGGSCVDELVGFRCVCLSGFIGTQCQTNVDDCSHEPCLNGGMCRDGVDAFMCECPVGFSGHLCQHDSCANYPCANGGTCSSTSNGFHCQCPSGWGGRDCSDRMFYDSPCDSSPCQNGGTCTPAPELSSGYRCTCPSRLIGPQCTVPTENYGASGDAQAVVMSSGRIIVVVIASIAVPALVIGFCIAICIHRRRKLDRVRTDDEARRQNEQNTTVNAVNNKFDSHMIINSLDYPVKPINTESQYNQIAGVHQPSSKQYAYQEDKLQHHHHQVHTQHHQLHTPPPYIDSCKKAVENTYSIVPARSTKTLNTDASNLSLAAQLEKGLDAGCVRRSPTTDEGSSYCKTPDSMLGYPNPNNSTGTCSSINSLHQQHNNLLIQQHHQHVVDIGQQQHNSTHTLSSTCGPPSTCTTPSSIYVIEEHYDDDNNDSYIATEV